MSMLLLSGCMLESEDHIMKLFNFGSRFFFLSGAATVAALVGGSVVGALMIVGLVAVAYKF